MARTLHHNLFSTMKKAFPLLFCFFFVDAFVCSTVFAQQSGSPAKLRVGHFPNVTHGPALIARSLNHFEKVFHPKQIEIEWKTFTAGPEAVEALAANALDLLFVGPNPAVNGFVRSEGELLRIIAGTSAGGSAFVVRKDSGIKVFEDIRGKRVASPQLGNTQDIALRYLMKEKGLSSKAEGGDVEIFNLSGGEQLGAFLAKQVGAVWAVEPWVSRLVDEAGGQILFHERELWPEGRYATTVLVTRKKFSDKHRDLVQDWINSYLDLISWINQNPEDAKEALNLELKRETGKDLPQSYLDRCFQTIQFTSDPMESSVLVNAERAYVVGFLGKKKPDLSGLFDLSFLNAARRQTPEGMNASSD